MTLPEYRRVDVIRTLSLAIKRPLYDMHSLRAATTNLEQSAMTVQ